MTSDPGDLRALARRTLTWWIPVGLLLVAVSVLTAPGQPAWRSVWGLGELALNRLGLTLPLVAFVAGLAAGVPTPVADPWLCVRRTGTRVLMAASVMAVVGYTFSNVAAPLLEYRYDAETGVDLTVRYPSGAATPGNLVRQRDAAESRSPAEYTFSTERPMARPPNWLTLLIHQRIAFAAFALPNALLGYLVALLTVDLRPIRRRQARWAAGLSVLSLFVVTAVPLDGWVRASPDNSGLVAAWLPLLGPCLLVLTAGFVVLRSGDDPPDWEEAD